MNTLLEVRQNILYKKKKSTDTAEELTKVHEIIFIVDEPKYSRTNEGDIVRERGCKELRLGLTSETLETLIEILTKYKDSKEEDLH